MTGLAPAKKIDTYMTVTLYLATLVDSGGKRHHGSINWDKYNPKQIRATICPHLTSIEIDYPVWTQASTYTRSGLETLIKKLKAKSSKLGFALTAEAETRFAAGLE